MDTGVAVAVGDVDLAGHRGDGGMGRAIEGGTAPPGSRLLLLAQSEDEPAVEGELADGVHAVVGAPDVAVGADGEPVGAVAEDALAPGAQEVAVTVEDHDRVRAAGERVDIVLGIDGNAGDLDEGVAWRELRPAFDWFVGEGAGTERNGHEVLLLE